MKKNIFERLNCKLDDTILKIFDNKIKEFQKEVLNMPLKELYLHNIHTLGSEIASFKDLEYLII